MKSNPAAYDLILPGSLNQAAALLSERPGEWQLIAGGTDVMVQFAAGVLPGRKLLSVWNLPELRRIESTSGELLIGAAATYTDLRRNPIVGREFPLLAQAASWTGGIANQNRGTLGGNIANASPAADSLPALLAYEAELILFSARGERRVAYTCFHTGYKKCVLAADELIRAIALPRRFGDYFAYSRKVGARLAQAISKVCVAALGHIEKGAIQDVRIALGSVAPVPIRLHRTEALLMGKNLDAKLIDEAHRTATSEITPIDDIRSTARYRAAVTGNLVAEFLEQLAASAPGMSEVLARWNALPPAAAAAEILPCCGSESWAQGVAARRPLADTAALLEASDAVWRGLPEKDWLQAFASHPRIGESAAPAAAKPQSGEWSRQEQQKVVDEGDGVKAALAKGNREYEKKFHRTFIVCATGKSGAEMLEILRRRLHNDPVTELHEAAEQQRQITRIRLKKWLGE